jgi:hypothetical protein
MYMTTEHRRTRGTIQRDTDELDVQLCITIGTEWLEILNSVQRDWNVRRTKAGARDT